MDKDRIINSKKSRETTMFPYNNNLHNLFSEDDYEDLQMRPTFFKGIVAYFKISTNTEILKYAPDYKNDDHYYWVVGKEIYRYSNNWNYSKSEMSFWVLEGLKNMNPFLSSIPLLGSCQDRGVISNSSYN